MHWVGFLSLASERQTLKILSRTSPVYTDQVSVAGLIADDQYFSAVEEASHSFGADIEDGILGLAFQSVSELKQPPYFQSVGPTISLSDGFGPVPGFRTC
jgi:hypothetical protein